jgi:hypothetical protein
MSEITSGLPDDSREADESEAERLLRDLRVRVKLARAFVARTPGLAEILATDWEKAARFYARFCITESQLRQGVPGDAVERDQGPFHQVRTLYDEIAETRARAQAPAPA